MQVDKYIEDMYKHIGDKCKVITYEQLMSTYKKAQLLLIKFQELTMKGEV